MTGLPPPKRPRGAPKGNRNALKHGFYSQQFRPADLRDLKHQPVGVLASEINLLRVLIRRLVERSSEEKDISLLVDILRAISLSTNSITRLIKVQHFLNLEENDSFTDQVNQAIDRFTEEVLLTREKARAEQGE
jgi:hypothetical protein